MEEQGSHASATAPAKAPRNSAWDRPDLSPDTSQPGRLRALRVRLQLPAQAKPPGAQGPF